MEVLVNSLKSNNFKITPQRIAIYREINNTNEHPNAETIYKRLEPNYPTISLATVYKSLELFAELNMIQIINIGGNSYRYDPNIRKHPHIICNVCQKIEDLDNRNFEHLSSEVEGLTNYKITDQQLCFYGVCSSCASKKI